MDTVISEIFPQAVQNAILGISIFHRSIPGRPESLLPQRDAETDMWIAGLRAMRRPYTFAVVALLLMVSRAGWPSFNMPVDIFPNINIPSLPCSGKLHGLLAEQMAGAVSVHSSAALPTTSPSNAHRAPPSRFAERHRRRSKIFFQPGRQHRNLRFWLRLRPSRRPRSASCLPEPTPPLSSVQRSSVPIIR